MEEVIRVLYKTLLDQEIREGRSEYIKESREKAEALEYHFENEYPEKLLRTQHPSEEPWMREYRKRRWQAPTKVATGRVFTFLQKIQQADDFKIRFESDFKKTGIAERIANQSDPNTLEYYVKNMMPKVPNMETWLFNVFLKTYLQDANAVVAMLPKLDEFIEEPERVSSLDWSRPYPQTFESDDLIYEEEDWVILEVEEYKDSNKKEWQQFLAITKVGIFLFRQVSEYREMNPFKVYGVPFNFTYLPVIKVGNIIYEEEDGHLVYDSVLAPCLPAWNEVLFRTDDLNIMYAVHALPQKWALKLTPCKTCNGSGTIINQKHEQANCTQCNGTGRASSSPFGLMEINIDRISAINPNPIVPPVPPAGYIERPVDSVRLFQEDIIYKEYQGFKAIGLEILGQIPGSQSGIAKEYDRKELNTFCYSVSIHLAKVYKIACYHILYQRYNNLFASSFMTDEKIQYALPDITIPTDFDVLTAATISTMLSEARRNGYNPIIVHGIEMDYVEKLYGENSVQKTYLKIVNALDPLPFKTTDEKTILVQTNGCSKIDFVLSTNLPSIIMVLSQDDPSWYTKSLTEQRVDVYRLAGEKMALIEQNMVPIVDTPTENIDETKVIV
jgi:hypothetical protein